MRIHVAIEIHLHTHTQWCAYTPTHTLMHTSDADITLRYRGGCAQCSVYGLMQCIETLSGNIAQW